MLDEEWLRELFSPHGRVGVRRLFGGQSVHVDGLVVALVLRDVLYLKADAETAAAFDAEDLPPFRYVAKGNERTIASYRRAPDEALEDAAALAPWARLALAAAHRVQLAKRAPRRREPKAARATKG